MIGEEAQAFSFWRQLLSGVKEMFPFKEHVICYPGKWTILQRDIQYLRELTMMEMIYNDLDNKQLSTDPREVKST